MTAKRPASIILLAVGEVRSVQYSKSTIKFFAIITTAIIVIPAHAQSGRGRPKVPQPTSPNSQPAAAVNVPAAAAVTSKDQIGNTSRFVLRNGITVIISEHHSAPIVAAVARFKAGPLDEPWSMSGPATLVGRLILRGTVNRPGGQAVDGLRNIGASVEANLSYDGAEYLLVSSSEKLKDALAIQADLLQNAALDSEAIRQETQRLLSEEKSGGTALVGDLRLRPTEFVGDTPDAALRQFDEPSVYSTARLFNLAFTGSTARTRGVSSVTREQLVEFYKSHYRPDNMIISITGDVSTFNTLVEIQRLYGDFGVKPAKPADSKGKTQDASRSKPGVTRPPAEVLETRTQTPKPALEPTTSTLKQWGTTEQLKLQYAAERGDINQTIVTLGFHVPGAESKDWPALEVLTALAGHGRASRLARSVIQSQTGAQRIASQYLAYAGSGALILQMWSAKDAGESIDKAESALFRELDQLRRETPTEGEMLRAKALLEKRFVDRWATYTGRAEDLARAEATGTGMRAALDYRSRIRSVTAADIQRVASRYLTLANTSIYELEPLSATPRTFDPETFATTVAAWAPGFSRPVEPGSVREAEPTSSLAPVPQGSERSSDRQAVLESVQPLPVRDYSTLNGPRAFVREDHSRQTVTVAILFQGGRLVEDAATSGITELMLRTMLYGTARRNFSQVTEELEQLGAEIAFVVEPDFFGFMMSVLSRNADRALKQLRDVVEEPAFRKDDISRARLGQLAAIRDARDSGFMRSRELLMQSLYPGHAYSLPPHGREEVILALNEEKLGEWYARAIGRQLPLAVIVGDTDGSALVSSQLAEGFKRRDLDAALQVRTPQTAAAAEKTEARRVEHSSVAVGRPAPRAGSADVMVIKLVEALMNGEGGRLRRELGDSEALASTAAFTSESMFVAGVVGAYASTLPEHEQRMKTALLGAFESLGRLNANDISSSRALGITSRYMLLQSHHQQALQYARAVFYKQQAIDVDNFAEQISKVTLEDFKRVLGTFSKSGASSGIVHGSKTAPQAKQN